MNVNQALLNVNQALLKENLYIFTDGGARGNPGPAAIGFVIKNSQGKVIFQKGKYIGKATNNMAEYTAVIEALSWLKSSLPTEKNTNEKVFNFFLDSNLVVNQLNGLFKVKNLTLRKLIIFVRTLEREIDGKVVYNYISREKNSLADRLLNQILNQKLR